jgi:hypothetical protein
MQSRREERVNRSEIETSEQRRKSRDKQVRRGQKGGGEVYTCRSVQRSSSRETDRGVGISYRQRSEKSSPEV